METQECCSVGHSDVCSNNNDGDHNTVKDSKKEEIVMIVFEGMCGVSGSD